MKVGTETSQNPKSGFWLVAGLAALAVLGALLFIPSFAPYLLRFEHWTADWRTALFADRERSQDPRIGIVLINDETLQNYASSPIDRELLAQIVRAIDDRKPTAIGLDILFLKKTEPVKDDALLAALATAKAKIVLGAIDERGDLQGFQKEFQHDYLAETHRPVGFLNLHHDHDDVVRYMAAAADKSAFPSSFSHVMAEASGASVGEDRSRPIPWLGPPVDSTSPFYAINAQDLLANPRIGAELKDRLVIIGGDFPLRDRHRTPLTARTGESLAGVFIHAHILAALLDPQRDIAELNPMDARLVLAAVGMFGFVLGWRLGQSLTINYFGAGFATVVLLVLDALCYKELRLLLPFTLALVAWVAGLTAGRSIRHAVPGRASKGQH